MKTELLRHKVIYYVLFFVSAPFLTILFYFHRANQLLFHMSFGFALVIIGVLASLVGILTTRKSNYNILSRLSPSLLFASIILFLHTVAYPGMNIFASSTENLSVQLKMASEVILSIGVLSAVLDRKGIMSMSFRIFFTFVVSVAIVFIIFLNLIPDMTVGGSNSLYRSLIQILLTLFYLSVLLKCFLSKIKDCKHSTIFMISIGLMMLSEFLFIFSFDESSIILYIALLLKYIGLVILLYLIVRENLIVPYNNLVISLIEDKNREKKLYQELSEIYQRLSKSQDIGKVGTWELDIQTKKIWASDQAFRIYGLEISDDNLIDLQTIQEMVVKTDRSFLDKALSDLITENIPYNVTFQIVDGVGERHYLNSVASLEYDSDGKPVYVNGVIHDISILKAEQDKLIYQSMHDHLTGVYNRRYFSEKRETYDKEEFLPTTVVIIDINGLKIINDSFGHHVGNLVLKRLGTVLEESITSEHDFVARIGGDEFALFLTGTTHEMAETLMQNILKRIEREKVGNVVLSVAFGSSTREDLKENIDTVLKKAEDEMYLFKISDSLSVRNKIIDALLTTLYEKDYVSEEHSQRVSDYAFFLAKAYGLTSKKLNDIKTAGLLHDIGKITISNDILNKKGKLTDSEYRIIKTHPEKGYKIIHSIGDMDIIANYVYQHHEYYDGKGYPKGMSGEDISLEARIIAIADAYDAMTSYRDYKAQMTKEEAVDELLRCKGTQFDPNLVDIFIKKVLNIKKASTK